jgi:hypothetical protein
MLQQPKVACGSFGVGTIYDAMGTVSNSIDILEHECNFVGPDAFIIRVNARGVSTE